MLVGKAFCSWLGQWSIQECREACGGHGYLANSRLPQLRNDNDASVTYEGDNNVILQQTANWILALLKAPPQRELPESASFLCGKDRAIGAAAAGKRAAGLPGCTETVDRVS